MGQERLRIGVGSANAVKITAVRTTFADYEELSTAEIDGHAASSGVSEQPKTLAETISGAKNRAAAALVEGCNWGVGLEDGFIAVPESEVGFMNVCVCAIFDRKRYFLGFSSAFECPGDVVKGVIEQGLDLNQALIAAGRTEHPRIGSSIGAVGVFTGGRVTREGYTRQAIQMALVRARGS